MVYRLNSSRLMLIFAGKNDMKWLKLTGFLFVAFLLVIAGYMMYASRDRHPGYEVDISIPAKGENTIKTGFAALPITPEVTDTWVDVNNNAEFDKGIDTWEDVNGNGKFDAVWIAGFQNRKPAAGIHDNVWARTMVIDDGNTRIAIVALDAIGFMHDDVVDVRKRIPESAGVDYTVICSTHTHEAPDLLGMWGGSYLKSGVNSAHMEYVKDQTARSVVEAVNALRPAVLKFAFDPDGADDLLIDTRKPKVFDSGFRIIQAIDAEDGQTLGSLAAWADHPETLWSDNLLISSDFPHYIREGIEKGVYKDDTLKVEGIGGICVYINGAVGGLMTTHPRLALNIPFTNDSVKEPNYIKAKAQGDKLAMIALSAIGNSADSVDHAGISIRARTIEFPVDNPLFRLGTFLGVLNRGMTGWMKMRSEISAFSIGPASFITVPGEVYPEIINGGVEAPAGRDFNIDPVEVPSIRNLMGGKYKFVIGLANDEIGYIVPKSQWDEKAPFTYGRNSAPYGEENSLGPETGPILHGEFSKLLGEFKGLQ